ncbi:hypothetical protein SCA6_016524 [Theobroma cacao]
MGAAHQASPSRSCSLMESDPEEDHALAGLALEDLTRTLASSLRSSTRRHTVPDHYRTEPWSFAKIWATHRRAICTRPRAHQQPGRTSRMKTAIKMNKKPQQFLLLLLLLSLKVVENGYPCDQWTCNIIISGRCRSGQTRFALDILRGMNRNGSFNADVSGDRRQVIKFFENMVVYGISPNVVTFTIVIDILCKERKMAYGKKQQACSTE